MKWETPRYIEIKMDAEITSYQDDFDPTRDPLFDGARPAAEAPLAREAGAAE
ncbi:MAG TPA: hypothetical protein VFS43_40425 [Polyangiaceae bacterium]|nr:hypothetical protein [Polyangiaceae bacterium]